MKELTYGYTKRSGLQGHLIVQMDQGRRRKDGEREEENEETAGDGRDQRKQTVTATKEKQ